MSKGHGDIQRRVLNVLRDRATVVDSVTITAAVFGRDTVTLAESSSVRRALRRLGDEGHAVDMGRGWRFGRRCWAVPAVAEQYRKRVAAVFGS